VKKPLVEEEVVAAMATVEVATTTRRW